MRTPEKDPSKVKYLSEADIPQIIQPDLSDYKNSGFEIGRLLIGQIGPGFSNKKYLLYAASPQVPQFNKVYWVKFENYVRELVKKLSLDRIVTFTGPLKINRLYRLI